MSEDNDPTSSTDDPTLSGHITCDDNIRLSIVAQAKELQKKIDTLVLPALNENTELWMVCLNALKSLKHFQEKLLSLQTSQQQQPLTKNDIKLLYSALHGMPMTDVDVVYDKTTRSFIITDAKLLEANTDTRYWYAPIERASMCKLPTDQRHWPALWAHLIYCLSPCREFSLDW